MVKNYFRKLRKISVCSASCSRIYNIIIIFIIFIDGKKNLSSCFPGVSACFLFLSFPLCITMVNPTGTYSALTRLKDKAPRQDRSAILGGIVPPISVVSSIVHLGSSPFRCFSDHMFMDSTYFPLIFRSFAGTFNFERDVQLSRFVPRSKVLELHVKGHVHPDDVDGHAEQKDAEVGDAQCHGVGLHPLRNGAAAASRSLAIPLRLWPARDISNLFIHGPSSPLIHSSAQHSMQL